MTRRHLGFAAFNGDPIQDATAAVALAAVLTGKPTRDEDIVRALELRQRPTRVSKVRADLDGPEDSA